MAKNPWIPWHRVVQLREDVLSGELSLALFAADLYEVALQKGRRPAYEDPTEFFAFTYPTANLRDIVRDVALRLAGRSPRAVRQLELTYGGGKTHTLITLFHLFHERSRLPDLASVREFREHAGLDFPKTRVAVLPFDKLDVEKGMEVPSPAGNMRRLKQPWSVLAWQIAGEAGLRLLHAEDKAEERESAPAEGLLEELLRLPQKEDLATLLLVDEVLMYAHEKVAHNPEWLGRLRNFFQYLTQAVVKVERAGLIVSLLATDPAKSDERGKQILKELAEVLAREREEGVMPVLKEDVAEVLRRRFFTPKSIENKDAFREHVFAALQGIVDLDENTRKSRKAAEERFAASYPFHPDLTEVFYGKWTNLDAFQRTRGVLRIFALALRDARGWDDSPLVGPSVFLSKPGQEAVCEATRELAGVAMREPTEGTAQNWTAILESEFRKAREVQEEFPALAHRELEQAVFATFIHSQPITNRARLHEIIALVAATRPDRITLDQALRRWFDVSWFLDEAAESDGRRTPDGPPPPPAWWRLGSKPNLRQMHHDACDQVHEDLVEPRLREDIRKQKSLTAGASSAGARVHLLPERPSMIDDDGAFHYAVLGPEAASESGKPSTEARRFIDENTGPHNPRKERNAVVLAVPSREGLDAARRAVRDYLGWERVLEMLRGQQIEASRAALLDGYRRETLRRIPDAIAQAYCIVVTVSEKNDVQAFKIAVGDEPLFLAIKSDKRSRIQDAAISPDAILPGGPYDLWREGEDARRVRDLVGAFARFPHLPKMLSVEAVRDTIVMGCSEGIFVGRVTRPDRSVKTVWRQRPEGVVMDDTGLEVVLPQRAELTELDADLLTPGALPDLWVKPQVTVGEVHAFFSGGRSVRVKRGDFEETVPVPRASEAVLNTAIGAAVRDGKLWLSAGPASLLAEEVPAGILSAAAVLRAPPPPLNPVDILPAALPGPWRDNETNGLALATAVSQRAEVNLPWKTVRDVIDGALRAHLVELVVGSTPWPCDLPAAVNLRLRVATAGSTPPRPPDAPPARPGVIVAEGTLTSAQVQDLAEGMGEILKAKKDCDLSISVRLELAAKKGSPEEAARSVDEALKTAGVPLRFRG